MSEAQDDTLKTLCPKCGEPINMQHRIVWDAINNVAYHIGCEPRRPSSGGDRSSPIAQRDTLDTAAIEARETEARRKLDDVRDSISAAQQEYRMLILAGYVPALCDDIKALREALAERDKRIADMYHALNRVLARLHERCDQSDLMTDDEAETVTEANAVLFPRARQEAKPHE